MFTKKKKNKKTNASAALPWYELSTFFFFFHKRPTTYTIEVVLYPLKLRKRKKLKKYYNNTVGKVWLLK